jgi:energy-coupling factor transporter ATP-binding protein EcfA2
MKIWEFDMFGKLIPAGTILIQVRKSASPAACYLILGPTASGKTSLQQVLQKRLPGKAISEQQCQDSNPDGIPYDVHAILLPEAVACGAVMRDYEVMADKILEFLA